MLVCDFCSGAPVRWRYPTRTFRVSAIRFRSVEDWAACDACHELIEAGDRDRLLDRTMTSGPPVPPGLPASVVEKARESVRQGQALFFQMREGAAVPVEGET